MYILMAELEGSPRPDHLIIIDGQKDSDTYGQVIATSEVTPGPTRNVNGNDAHHITALPDRTWLVSTGLSSSLLGKDAIFTWKVGDDLIPQFFDSYNFFGYGCPDTPMAYNDTTLLLTFLCDENLDLNGGLILFSPDTATWEPFTPLHDHTLQPHAGEFSTDNGLMIANYPYFDWNAKNESTTVPDLVEGTLLHFNFDGTVNTTVRMPQGSAGFMGFNWVNGTDYGFTQSAFGEQVVFRVQAGNPVPKALINLSDMFGHGYYSAPSSVTIADGDGLNGTRYIFTFQLRYLLVMGYDPVTDRGSILHIFDFCNPPTALGFNTGAEGFCDPNDPSTWPGTHFMRIDKNFRVVLTNFFIPKLGHDNGIHAFQMTPNNDGFVYDVPFSEGLRAGLPIEGMPHGVVIAGFPYQHLWANPGAYVALFLAYPLAIIFLWFCYKISGKKDETHEKVVVPPLFGWHNIINTTEWRIICAIQSLFIIGGIIQSSLGKTDKIPASPMWSVAAQITQVFTMILFGPSWSLFGLVARAISVHLPFAPAPSQPKKFAAILHMMMGASSFGLWFILHTVDHPGAFTWVLVLFVLLLWLDAIVGFCFGCWAFAYIMAPHNLYFKSELEEYHRDREEGDMMGTYYRWIPKFYKKHNLLQHLGGARKWAVKCENGICTLDKGDGTA